MPWDQPRNPAGFGELLTESAEALRKKATRLRRSARGFKATRDDMRKARLAAAAALVAAAELLENRVFADFGNMPAGQKWHPEGDPSIRR